MIILIILIIIIAFIINYYRFETFNDQSGQFCLACENKNFNQCTACFNCSWCDGKCIAGDLNGPYNNQRCNKYYNRDAFSQITVKQNLYDCSKDYRKFRSITSI